MDFISELDSMDLPASLHEAVSGAYSALFEEFSPEVLAAIRNGMFEAASSVLYHFVTAGNLCQMIRNDRFTPSDHERSINGGKRFMSFSRTGNFEEGWPALFYSSSNSDDWCMVRLTIDGDRFNTHPNVRDSAGKRHPVTVRPTDWRHAMGKTPGKEAMMASRGKHLNKFTGKDLPDSQGHPWAQSEDRLLTDSDQIPGFLDYVKRIDIILKTDACTGDNESVRRALARNLNKIAGTGKVHVFASLADFKKGAECPVEAIAPKAINESVTVESTDKKHLPLIICADMGVGKTTFIEKVNRDGRYRGYDLEVCDIPGIWGQPRPDDTMELVTGWEKIALDRILRLRNVDFVVTTSSPKMVRYLLSKKIPFVLSWKTDMEANRGSIVERTASHFSNVVHAFSRQIAESSVPDALKRRMFKFVEYVDSVKVGPGFAARVEKYLQSDDVLGDPDCMQAIPPEIIESDAFQSDDRYRHWHDMFRVVPHAGKMISITDQNMVDREARLGFFGQINDSLCIKMPLKNDEFLSSGNIFGKLIALRNRDYTFKHGAEPINACLESSATARLVKYLNKPPTIDISDDDDMVDTYQPAYNYFDNAREVHDVWAVHFTGAEAYEDIQQSGFSNGTTNLDCLAYTNNHSDNERSRNGWLFALPIDCPYLKHYDLGYGDCGFIIKTSGVLAHHRVDGDDEVLFRNRDVSVKIPIIFDEDYDRWLAYPDSDKPLKSRRLTRLIDMVIAGFKDETGCPAEGIAPNALHESCETITPMFESEHTRRLQEVYALMQEAYDKLKVTFDSAVKAVKGIPALAKRIAREESIPYDEAYARAKEKSDPFSMIAPHGRIVVKLREGMPGVMCRMQHVKPTVDNFALSVVFDFDEYANSYYDANMNMVVICLKPLIERARMAVAPDIRSQIVHGEHPALDTVWDVEDLFAILNDDSIQQVMMHELVHHVQDRVGELPDRQGYTRFFEESGLPDDDATYHDVLPHEINAEMISRLRDCFYLYSRPRAMTQIAKELYDYYMKKRLRYVPELPQHVYDRMKRQCWEIAVSMARAFVQSFEKNNGDWSKAKEKAIVRDLDSFDV